MPHDEQYREMLAKDKGLRQIHNKVTEWQEKMAEGGYRLSEGLMIGGRSLGEIMDQLGVKPEEMNHEGQRRIAALYLDSLNKTHNKDGQLCPPVSAVVYEKKTGETKLEQPGWGDGFVASMQPVHLTKWDKFCRFFGVTTSRIRYNKMVEESQRLAEAKKNNIETTRVKVDGAKRREFLTNPENKEAYENNQKVFDDTRENIKKWNKIMFGEEKPEPVDLPDDQSISTFAYAVCWMMENEPQKLQKLIRMKPEEVEKDKEMLAFVRKVGKVYELYKNQGDWEMLDYVTYVGNNFDTFYTVQEGLDNLSMSQISVIYPFLAAKQELAKATENECPAYSNMLPEEKLVDLAFQKAYAVKVMHNQMKECNYEKVKDAVEYISKEKVGDSNIALIEKAGGLLQKGALTLAREELQAEQSLENEKVEVQPKQEPDLDSVEPEMGL